MRFSNKIVLASTNGDKLKEFKEIWKIVPEVEITSPELVIRNVDKLALVEVHATYLENAIAKSRIANQGSHYPCLADDSGLEVDALDGKPGVHSFRYAKTPHALSKIEQYRANLELLLSELSQKPQAPKTGRFICALALTMEGVSIHATGTLEGTIIETPKGQNGFGYDPVFVPKGYSKTLAEMTENEKNKISHRAEAVRALLSKIKEHGFIFVKP